MSELTNLTDRIAHLRDRKGSSAIINTEKRPDSPQAGPSTIRERRFATDLFMLFAYGLLAIGLAAQLVLIVWLDIV